MSYMTIVHVRCDWKGCRAAFHYVPAERDRTLTAHFARGWVLITRPTGRALHRCPRHRPKALRR